MANHCTLAAACDAIWCLCLTCCLPCILKQAWLPACTFSLCRRVLLCTWHQKQLLNCVTCLLHVFLPSFVFLTAQHRQPSDTAPNSCPAAEFPDVAFDIRLMPELMHCVAASDCIFAASGSEHILISAADLANMGPASEAVGGLRRFFDISVPRNIHSNINSQLEGRARVFNVDDLKEVVEANKEARKQAAAEAELLLREEQLAFECWRDGLATVPTIKALRSKAESVRALELEKALNKLGDGLTKKQLRAVEDLSRGIVNKLLHGPMTALRCDSSDTAALSETLANMEALERMFELSQIELSQLVQR